MLTHVQTIVPAIGFQYKLKSIVTIVTFGVTNSGENTLAKVIELLPKVSIGKKI